MSIFVNEGYEDFKYLVEVNDNYIVLSNSSKASGDWNNTDEIDIIYQYLKPSTVTIEGVREFNRKQYFERVEVSNNYFDRADCCEILSVSLMVLTFFIFILNGFTRVFKKGGMFFGN